MSKIDNAYLLSFFKLAADRLEARRQELCSLDGEIGDGDHGTSMANGFAAIDARLREVPADTATPALLLREAASAFIGEVGATVGPLYATALLQGAALLEDGPLERDRLGDLLAQFAAGIGMRGQAQPGDKTMLDAWVPATQAARNAAAGGASAREVAEAAAAAARKGADTTASMVASRGRAARLKERSLGHPDPGAVSAALIIGAFAEIEEDPA
ncbi:dihydroxyacetone kinase subunit DhaL [Tropicimonas isoalkanivorans]|uniref:Dihydroxyacetone kinase, C-terminal domain n=1 Tax=Tropicimonas isoalkanivorans TaxID=441112 RepID=A0A1I1MKR9_9RHOB|nr:dihydroxyacetone kinase subunit DhaL [Tropicimonas isoalkanivorans]SFC85715.1 dihydroxyacetone kinase, C-terminal domain [Tropicimonas isoalkanivorans]